MAQKVIKKIKDNFNVTIMLGDVNYDGWSYFSLRNVGLADHKSDTLFFAGRLQFDITGIAIDSAKFTLSNIGIDEGLCKLITYKDSTWGLSVLDNFSNPNDSSVSQGPSFQLVFKNVEVIDTRFMMIDSTADYMAEGFNHNNMQFSDIDVRSKVFNISGDSLNFNFKNLRCQERSGINVKNFSADAIICSNIMEFKNLFAHVNNSTVKNYFAMDYDTYDDFEKFDKKVILKGNLSNSVIDMQDVAIFASALKDFKYNAKVSGNFSGPLSKLRVRDIVASYANNTRFVGKVNLTGLPNINETFIEVSTEFASTNKQELENIIAVELPEILAELGKINFRGVYTGFYKDFVSYGTFESAFGIVETDLNMKLADNIFASSYSGHLKFNDFALGKFLKNSSFGRITGNAEAIGSGLDLKNLNSRLIADINKVDFNHYPYQNIKFNIVALNQSIDGNLNINDPNLSLDATGLADLRNNQQIYNFKGNVTFAKLKALNFTTENINISTHIMGNFNYTNINNNSGKVSISNTLYDKNGYNYRIENLTLESKKGKQNEIKITGDNINGQLVGNYDLENIYNQLYNYTTNVAVNYFTPKKLMVEPNQNFTLKLNIGSTQSYSALLFPGIDVFNLKLEAEVNSTTKSYEIKTAASTVKYHNYFIKNPALKITLVNGDKLEFLGGLNNFLINDTNLFGDMAIQGAFSNNIGSSTLIIADSLGYLTGNLNNSFSLYKDSIICNFGSSQIGNSKVMLNINDKAIITYAKNNIYYKNVQLFNAKNDININGYQNLIAKTNDINATITKFNFNTLNSFIPQINFNINGLCVGNINFKTIAKRQVVISNLKVNNLSLDNDTIGNYSFESDFTENEKGIWVEVKSIDGKIKNLKGSGLIDLAGNDLHLEVSFDRSDIVSFQAFLKDYITFYQGKIAMAFKIEGKIDNPEIYGNMGLSGIKMRIEYLKTIYNLSANLNFNKNQIEIEPFKIFDKQKNAANVKGKILHKNFSNFNYNIKIDDFKNFEILNTTAKDNGLFYGTAFATGNAEIKGLSDHVLMVVNTTTNKGTAITINPFVNSENDGSSIINFVNYNDTLPGDIAAYQAVPLGFGIKLNIKATTDAEIKMIFDPNADDNIRATGNGNLTMELTTEGEFLMNGNYTLLEGDYRFTAVNVVSKRFKLVTGSSISWNGDPFLGVLDITGVYKLRTTINEIVRLPEGSNNQSRIPVDCIIKIKGTVERPIIGFDLNFPELDNYVTGTANNELIAVVANFRREPDLMNQQILFLLISGKFIPLNSSNTNQGVNIGEQTVSDLFSSSASRMLNSFIPNFDVSIDMLNATDPSRGRAYLLSASKRFLDNRLEVQGSYATDNSQNNFTASYNIVKSGSLKSRVFNRSGLDPIYNRNITTSGLGLYYRKEFDSFIELLKKQNQFNH